jgi:hypothetical protein
MLYKEKLMTLIERSILGDTVQRSRDLTDMENYTKREKERERHFHFAMKSSLAQ